jgi:wobble nucleotide-excising tRNase
MPIRTFERIADKGVLRNYSWPDDLPPFGRRNVIFGWNGSGKSTLCSLFRLLELRRPLSAGEVVVSTDDAKYSQRTLPDFEERVRVFDREYIRQNVFRSEGTAASIFVLGEENVAHQKELLRLKDELSVLSNQRGELAQRLKEASLAFNNFETEGGRLIKRCLGRGGNFYFNYNKNHFSAKARELSEHPESLAPLSSSRASFELRCEQRPKDRLSDIQFNEPHWRRLWQDADELLHSVIEPVDLDALNRHPKVLKWQEEGLHLHDAESATTCLYCGQEVPNLRVSTLRDLFKGEFEALQGRLGQAINRISLLERELPTTSSFPKQVALYDDLQPTYAEALAKFTEGITQIRDSLRSLKAELESKRLCLFEASEVVTQEPQSVARLMEALRLVIAMHNERSENFESELVSAQRAIEADIVLNQLGRWKELKLDESDRQLDVSKCRSAVDKLSQEIRELEFRLISDRLPAKQINEDLQRYLGHNDLELVPEEGGYRIVRDRLPAEDLSEGERTAVALLHFLRTLNDKDGDCSELIVVLDDPVTSLDANALFSAFAFIKANTEEAKQLFLLTHNLSFFRSFRAWFQNCKERKECRLYMLRCVKANGIRASRLQKLDVLLDKYESDYHYLFQVMWDAAHAEESESFVEVVAMPTVARRVLETFLAFIYPQVGTGQNKDFHQRLLAATSDSVAVSRIYRFVNVQSHRNRIGEGDEEVSLLAETKAILGEICDLIKAVDRRHFDGMLRAIDRSE